MMNLIFRKAKDQTLDFIFPQHCVLCGSIVKTVPWFPAPLCSSCEQALESIKGPRCKHCGRELISEQEFCMDCHNLQTSLRGIIPIFNFRGNAANLIYAFKTGQRISLARYFAYRISLLDELAGNTVSSACLVPVPPRLEKLKSGKFDQVGVIAESLMEFGFHYEKMLSRLPGSSQQKLLDRAGRLKNASLSYTLLSDKKIMERIILLDDVCTTGATLEACTRLLMQNGNEVAGAVVLAAD
ncbi:MAG: DNA utilization protein GntX [Spirochaetes bacterium ADurb.Bin110]|nr:MAG: DNA utilization protein GntX [Spirochaetes bacterium ADurb.Bin110]